MNRDEAITKIYGLKPDTKLIENYYSEELHSFEKGFEAAKVMTASIVNKLDRLEKVLVPQYIADWIDACKENLPLTLADAMNPIVLKSNNQSEKTIHWIRVNQVPFAKAWIFGYEVEKEKLYTVKLKLTNEYLYCNRYYIVISHNKVPDDVAREAESYHFTEDNFVKYHVWENTAYEVNEVR